MNQYLQGYSNDTGIVAVTLFMYLWSFKYVFFSYAPFCSCVSGFVSDGDVFWLRKHWPMGKGMLLCIFCDCSWFWDHWIVCP